MCSCSHQGRQRALNREDDGKEDRERENSSAVIPAYFPDLSVLLSLYLSFPSKLELLA